MARPTAHSISALKRFIEHEATGGVVLVIAAILALIAANTESLSGILRQRDRTARIGQHWDAFALKSRCCCGSMTG